MIHVLTAKVFASSSHRLTHSLKDRQWHPILRWS